MPKRIGIIGGGVVGSAVKHFFPQAKVYDKFKPIDPWDEVAASEYIFICVPTPYQKGFDLSAVAESVEKLNDRDGTVVIIKSTVRPGTTEMLQRKYPNLKLLFNPEFLDNRTAKEDFIKPDKQVVGFTEQSQDIAQTVLDMLPDTPNKHIVPATAAELAKYMVNTYYTTRVVFANTIFDVAEQLGVDYDQVRQVFENDRRVAPGHFDVWHNGFRGFDGKCLPKDLDAFIELAEDLKLKPELLKKVQSINKKLVKKTKPKS